ncbi:LPXTG cell wall anchor domain-containing protein [Mediterraneibacter sp. NSJ-55]|uniref:LPXTG cell wall anchor domain-containing protein n=1 Tax=Mediterraneibacter hominis TaxID=2763054 RepID=A0A923RPY6_9FIRM|nr:LPXTG cell wall anchor domain-containing protein [Mediterraneibacter hominis]MBC5689009.1 LPXTG cell wall anchor domain-containing protein [Mediterraneibacter hominis]
MKKKILCLLSVLTLSLSMAPCVYAANADTEQTETTSVITEEQTENETGQEQEEVSEEDIRMSVSFEGSWENDVLEVIQGTNLDQYEVEVAVSNLSTGTSDYSPLLNSMVSGFDNMQLGRQDVTVTWKGMSCTLKVNVVEGEVPKPAKIEAKLGLNSHYSGNTLPLGISEDKLRDFLYVDFYDEAGSLINVGEEPVLEISAFDTNVKGEHKVTVTAADFELSTEITVRIVPVKVLVVNQGFSSGRDTDVISIPVGGYTSRSLELTAVNKDNPAEVIAPLGAGLVSLTYYFPDIDVSKAGVREYSAPYYDEYLGVNTTISVKIKVGQPESVPAKDLLPEEAIATMPQGEVIGTWDVPSGEAGAGTWVFQTGLTQGQEVTVWSYHNGQWLKIGVYKADAEGNVTVTFTADQLSPILITKNETSSGAVSGGNADTENKSENVSDNKAAAVKTPQTGDTQNILLYVAAGLASFSVLGGSILWKLKKGR